MKDCLLLYSRWVFLFEQITYMIFSTIMASLFVICLYLELPVEYAVGRTVIWRVDLFFRFGFWHEWVVVRICVQPEICKKNLLPRNVLNIWHKIDSESTKFSTKSFLSYDASKLTIMEIIIIISHCKFEQ